MPQAPHQFASFIASGLKSGSYCLKLKQTVDLTDATGISHPTLAEASLRFRVETDAAKLSPTDVHSVYPPNGSSGAFGDVLPHIVLRRRTLPWDRAIQVPNAPWLALLVVADGEGAIAKSSGVSEFEALKREGNVWFPGQESLRPPADEKDVISIVRMPSSLFSRLCPSKDDLPLLAHARRVGTGEKAASDVSQDDWVACVLANRFPVGAKSLAEGTAYTVHLVSLEGVFRGEEPKPFAAVILPSLFSWSFTSTGSDPYDFRSLAGKINPDVLRPSVSGNKGDAQALLDLGYVPLNHRFRDGSLCPSWYRSPLVPMLPAPATKEFETIEPIYFADQLLDFDSELGMFDISRAAAWQLGRLLALQDPAYCDQVMSWRSSVKAEAIAARNCEAVAQNIPSAQKRGIVSSAPDLPALCRSTWTAEVKGLVGAFSPLEGGGPAETAARGLRVRSSADSPKPRRPTTPTTRSWVSRDTDPSTLFAAFQGTTSRKRGLTMAGPGPSGTVAGDRVQPPFMARLAGLSLLHEVPLSYLVPSDKMLASHEVRFFYLDPSWIAALLDGACAIGRVASIDQAMDRIQLGPLMKQAVSEGATVRMLRPGKEPEKTPVVPPRCTGFLLRSPLVEHWRGIEVAATDAAKNPLPVLRLDTLAKDILLGIFGGVISSLEILEPQEGAHYGRSKAMKMRSKVTGGPGKQDLDVQSDGDGVVKLTRLVEDLRSYLKEPVTSGHVAWQLSHETTKLVIGPPGPTPPPAPGSREPVSKLRTAPLASEELRPRKVQPRRKK